jgi:hypothetical protein
MKGDSRKGAAVGAAAVFQNTKPDAEETISPANPDAT